MNTTEKLPSIDPSMLLNHVQHKYAGDSWAVVAVWPEDWATIVSVGNGSIGSQFFTAWTKLLKPTTPIIPARLKQLEAVRTELKSGRKVISNTRMVPA